MFIYNDFPEYEPSRDESLPLFGLLILEKHLCNVENCQEWNRIGGLISKIVEFTSDEDELYSTCALKVLVTLLKTIEDSELSQQVSQKILEGPLMDNLVEILINDTPETTIEKQLATTIIVQLRIDENTMGEISPMICNALISLFVDRNLSIACEALSTISRSVSCCMVISQSERKIEVLQKIFSSEDYLCNGGAKLMENLCLGNYVQYSEIGASNIRMVNF